MEKKDKQSSLVDNKKNSNRVRKKRINAKLYTLTKIGFDGLEVVLESLPGGRLYSNGRYPTKITKDDLPKHFIAGKFYKNHGYISTLGVKDLVYVPNYKLNHFYKDDMLYISYEKKIESIQREHWFNKEYINYDHCISGSQIIRFIESVMEYSPDIDVKPIIAEIYKKTYWMIRTYPNDAEVVYGGDKVAELDRIFGGDPNIKE